MNKIIHECEEKLKHRFEEIDELSYQNQVKVISAFKDNKIATRHFLGTTGYGYGDDGREGLGKVYAQSFGAESAILSPHIVSGTHALTVALFGVLRPKDKVLCVTGMPYDTLQDVIFKPGIGSLKDFGVEFECIDLLDDNSFDKTKIAEKIKDSSYSMVYIQRSRGYELRDALSCKQIGEGISYVRGLGFTGCVFVDNCYGEFVQTIEPCDAGADVCVGSLIKNAGGGIAPTGGYIAGKQKYIEMIGGRLTAPSIGLEVGSYEQGYRCFYQGLFMAPHTVLQALKSSLLIGQAMDILGYENFPSMDKTPYDITRAIKFNDPDKMINFIREIQYASPIDGYVTCEPWDMPGYEDKIIMAAGTFVSGASIELSADGPVKPPYIAYFQGALTYEHGKYALDKILDKLLK